MYTITASRAENRNEVGLPEIPRFHQCVQRFVWGKTRNGRMRFLIVVNQLEQQAAERLFLRRAAFALVQQGLKAARHSLDFFIALDNARQCAGKQHGIFLSIESSATDSLSSTSRDRTPCA